ncbi:molecular chaperone HscC [Undibacterium sp. LX40W]|uniref:Molecular chaperone HscC n=1 Tax=Undibacterium nitidum TaxID=2762298 RepID=A0A923HQ40_9BURK|nr:MULTISPECIES: molecular chaperone HscC [Undibacterium]MBC3880402.1 molecular chaperone HscC [Undibacterium nitidum]MBC3890861.1 molecular chaperone HscC [Undibacterium sp. LX40W]
MIIGIDLGTTNSLVAIWRDGKAQLIPNSLGEILTPSCVSLDEDGSILVGRAARERLQTHPERTAAVFKRYMGSDKKIRLGDREFRAEELSSFVLKSLKADAEAFLGETVTEAVITVPAYFSDAQRKATKVAGQLANLKVDRLVNEPTAAALAYGMHQFSDECKFLVFDLGGGTFDVSILEMFDGVMEVRASAGDNYLGGEDITKVMVDAFIDKHQFPSKIKNDARFMQQLFAAAEKAKRDLTSSDRTLMEVQTTDQLLQLEFNEELLSKITAPLIKRLREPVERALRDTNLRSNQLDSIVLAGGATRMPIVKRLVTMMFGRFPQSEINPDEVVAMGAAVQAGLKMKDAALDEVVMTDVAPYSLGVDTTIMLSDNKSVGGHFSPIIERNSTVPVSRVKRYFPLEDKQDKLIFNIFQGESRLVKDNIFLGKMEFPLDPLPSEENGVDLRFTYDVNGLLEVQATVLRTQKKHAMVIQGNPGLLSDEQIAARFTELEKIKMHPRDTLENRTLMARADRVYQQLKGDSRAWLTAQIAEFERVVETQNVKLITPAQKKFSEILDEIERDVVLHPDFTE